MNNKRAIIYCFSGTGNTYIAAQKTADALLKYNVNADIFRVRFSSGKPGSGTGSNTSLQDIHTGRPDFQKKISKKSRNFGKRFKDVPNPNNYDLAIFSYPVYAFNTPWFFLEFIKCLPELNNNKNNMPAYIFKTSGEPFPPNQASSYSLVKALRKKGFKICSDMHMLMPYNLIFRYPDSMVKQMYIHTESMSKVLAGKIAAEDCSALKFNPVLIVLSYILRLQQFGAWLNGPLHKVNIKTCISCGRCLEACPSANIKFVKKAYKDADGNLKERQIPKMGSSCQMCMACTLNCPMASINPGFLTPWKVNPGFDFDKILKDDSIPSNLTDSPDAGYFKLFRKYYKKNPLM